MKKKMQKYGALLATLHDGKQIKVTVYKAGRAVELHFVHPYNGNPVSILVHPLNENTVQGWVHEIGVQCPSVYIARWEWEN